ncbi:MAG: alpha/beta fold hydrolase [Pseudomonadota bacterium]
MKNKRPPGTPTTASHGGDLLGASRLALEAVSGVTALVEAVHMNVLNRAIGTPAMRPVAGITSLVYRSVKGVTALVGGGIDGALRKLGPLLTQPPAWAGREGLIAALNGVVGDRLEHSANPLAIQMRLIPVGDPGSRVVVLVHGLCMNHLQWQRDGIDHGAMLAANGGYSTVYLHYNSGRHVSENGRDFADQLQLLLEAWPVAIEEIVLIGHSMGGLVARSACHYAAGAQHSWLKHLKSMVFLGTPHHGAPLERGGNWVHLITDLSAYSAPFSRLAKIRSAGITDLRYGSVLDEDWKGKDRFEHGLHPLFLALPAGVPCLAIAATTEKDKDSKTGDGLVPLASALGEHPDKRRRLQLHKQVVPTCNHMQLLSSSDVGQRLRLFLTDSRLS